MNGKRRPVVLSYFYRFIVLFSFVPRDGHDGRRVPAAVCVSFAISVDSCFVHVGRAEIVKHLSRSFRHPSAKIN